MNKSDTIATLAGALAKSQHNIGTAVKGAKNPFFKSSYADLGSVMEACKGPLLDQGIAVLQFVGQTNGTPYLETVLLHESGEFISDQMPLVCAKPHDPQAMGSAISYARRYALQSALFIPAVDDDAEAAQAPTRAVQSQDGAIEERETRREQAARQIGHEEPRSAFQEAKRVLSGDWRDVEIGFGKNKGRPLGELNTKQLDWYAGEWLEGKKNQPANGKDRALMDALEEYKKQRTGPDSGYDQANKILQDNKEDSEQEVPF